VVNVHIDYHAVQTSANQLKSGKEEIEGQLVKLKGLIDNLVASGFVTDLASGKFHQSYDQWNSGAKNVMGGLEGMSQFLQAVLTQHQNLDSQLSQSSGG
jgi:uncharacterized protein YukE